MARCENIASCFFVFKEGQKMQENKRISISGAAKKLLGFFEGDIVLTVALLLAAVSAFVVKPDQEYLGYVDYRTLILLYCLMLIIAGLREQNFFRLIGNRILGQVKTRRGVILTLVFLCFFSSMLITNDVALITFVPFGMMILEMAGLSSTACFVITMMTIAANLGSMLTPIGNPQNLYLYSVSEMGMGEFLLLMLPYAALAAVLLLIFVAGHFKSVLAEAQVEQEIPVHRGRVVLYLGLFFLCILSVMGVVSEYVLLPLIGVGIFLLNRRLFLEADYGLLLTFVGFFVFIGNMNRLEELRVIIAGIVQGHERLVAVLSSQVISNVPAAVLLSGYTDQVKELIVGTNLGGLGTLIASMASLISYKQLAVSCPERKRGYLTIFTFWNLVFLLALYALSILLSL